jgi:hypothetical protein
MNGGHSLRGIRMGSRHQDLRQAPLVIYVAVSKGITATYINIMIMVHMHMHIAVAKLEFPSLEKRTNLTFSHHQRNALLFPLCPAMHFCPGCGAPPSGNRSRSPTGPDINHPQGVCHAGLRPPERAKLQSRLGRWIPRAYLFFSLIKVVFLFVPSCLSVI